MQCSFDDIRAACLRDRNYTGYLLTFDSHQRLEPFLKLQGALSDEDYWRLLREVWLGVEVVLPDVKVWRKLWTARAPQPDTVMTRQERDRLAAQPSRLTLFRGFTHGRGARGWSWTLTESKARWFAEHANGSRRQHLAGMQSGRPQVAIGLCERRDVLALFEERNEDEVVIDPSRIKVVKKYPLTSNGWPDLRSPATLGSGEICDGGARQSQ